MIYYEKINIILTTQKLMSIGNINLYFGITLISINFATYSTTFKSFIFVNVIIAMMGMKKVSD